MKAILITLLLCVVSQAGMFGESSDTDPRRTHKELLDGFRDNVSNANAIIKRGEYEKLKSYQIGLDQLSAKLDLIETIEGSKASLIKDIKAYSTLVESVSQSLQKKAPALGAHHQEILEGLKLFNSKLASIGLRELLREWKQLSRLKHAFVKRPTKKAQKAFEESWTLVYVTITELYLDEEMEDPLFAFLEKYKVHFNELNAAYKAVGYDKVASIKPLGYKIKMQLELLPVSS